MHLENCSTGPYVESHKDRILLNVGGVHYETSVATLSRYPDTPLGELAIRHSQSPSDEYFFEQTPEVFDSVLYYYRTGELHVPKHICGAITRNEFQFWGLKEIMIQPCCWIFYSTSLDKVRALERLNAVPLQVQRENTAMLSTTGVEKLRLGLWRIVYRPSSSTYAKIYSVLSLMFVIASISGYCLETVPSLQNANPTVNNRGACQEDSLRNSTFRRLLPQPIFPLMILEYLCCAFFSAELVTRVLTSPNLRLYLRTPVTIIDVLALSPFYLLLVYNIVSPCYQEKHSIFFQVVHGLRIFRILRIFQILLIFKPLKVLMRTLRDSVYELLILMVFIIISVVLFATLAFYAEVGNDESTIRSIPIGLWWAVVTITTVGYGDTYPRTTVGYVVGGMCAIVGTVIMSLTIPILSNNFSLYYIHARSRDQALINEKESESTQEKKEKQDEQFKDTEDGVKDVTTVTSAVTSDIATEPTCGKRIQPRKQDLEDANAPPANFLEIDVLNPETHGVRNKRYTDYELRMRTNLPFYRAKESCVRRRYSDFEWLHGELKRDRKIMVPALPGKAFSRQLPFRGDDGIFEAEFIEERRLGLEQFINKIAGHPLAQNEKCLHIFLLDPVIDRNYVPGKVRMT